MTINILLSIFKIKENSSSLTEGQHIPPPILPATGCRLLTHLLSCHFLVIIINSSSPYIHIHASLALSSIPKAILPRVLHILPRVSTSLVSGFYRYFYISLIFHLFYPLNVLIELF